MLFTRHLIPRCSSSRSRHLTTNAFVHPVVYHPDFSINPIPDGHRFPMPKDTLLYLALRDAGMQRCFQPSYPSREDLTLVHDPAYVDAFSSGTLPGQHMRAIGLPWSPQLVQRATIGVGSAILAARLALQYGVACMTNGGTHHAHANRGAGWCIFNDLAVAAKAAQRDCAIPRVLLLDLDVHLGDGSATIFAEDPTVVTASMHCNAQPFPSIRPPSDLDVGLPAGTGDAEYMAALETMLATLGEWHSRNPFFLVLYNAGVDVHMDDTLGMLAVSDDGILARDRAVMAWCARHRLPVAVAIGGGYSPAHGELVHRHLCVHRAASEFAEELQQAAWWALRQQAMANT